MTKQQYFFRCGNNGVMFLQAIWKSSQYDDVYIRVDEKEKEIIFVNFLFLII